jgi:hypothetical protein
VIDGIMEGLADAGINAVQLTGQSSQADRQHAVDGFQKGAYQVFVGNIRAAGVGITLTASSHVVFAELDWVPGNVSQAEDRCHRIGQTESVLIEHLVFDGSLDATMAKTLVEKQAVIDQALDNRPDVHCIESYEPITEIEIEIKGVVAPPEITDEQVCAAHTAMQILAGMDADHAAFRNDMGFNRIDNRIGHELAVRSSLTPRQGALAAKIARKYHRQLPESLMVIIRGHNTK